MVWSTLVAALVPGMFRGVIGLPALASAAPAAHVTAAEQSMAQGWSAWQRGAFAAVPCVHDWTPHNAMSTLVSHVTSVWLSNVRYEPPAYWAPFLLLNNWL